MMGIAMMAIHRSTQMLLSFLVMAVTKTATIRRPAMSMLMVTVLEGHRVLWSCLLASPAHSTISPL